ncbi:(NiFe) hydrogenase maturation protein HypF [Mycobacterium lentiflavum]|uniref:acylphosphatase n=1 Tax=Mycobacterium lentiflavum TaxID=141349 RepID=A0A0E4CR16_MYCLN|nr:(NiFe) hydrogenase maturation protein HypF [Mycobacterium lentiflavum]
MTRRRLRICVHGVVQGVGFRPFVYTTAAALGLSGCVRNDSAGAIIEGEGDDKAVVAFLVRLQANPPPLAVIEAVETQQIPYVRGTGFVIADSSRSDGDHTLASPDVAMCAECAAEQRDPGNRRFRHAFVNCTNCGPRFTIIASLPYDRAATTMAAFPMCAECAHEYGDRADRRFHAQPVCCPNCGPTLRYRDHDGTIADGDAGLAWARTLLREGGVLAVKGVGGYHLACDAANDRVVGELRRRKRRGDKPFAVMVSDLTTARGIADVDETSARAGAGRTRRTASAVAQGRRISDQRTDARRHRFDPLGLGLRHPHRGRTVRVGPRDTDHPRCGERGPKPMNSRPTGGRPPPFLHRDAGAHWLIAAVMESPPSSSGRGGLSLDGAGFEAVQPESRGGRK